ASGKISSISLEAVSVITTVVRLSNCGLPLCPSGWNLYSKMSSLSAALTSVCFETIFNIPSLSSIIVSEICNGFNSVISIFAFCVAGLKRSSKVFSLSSTIFSLIIMLSNVLASPVVGLKLNSVLSFGFTSFSSRYHFTSGIGIPVTIHSNKAGVLDVATPAGLDALQEYIPASSSLTFVISKVAVVSNIVIVYFSLAWIRCLRFLLRSSTCVTSALICNLTASSSIILEATFSDTFSFILDFITTDSVMISSFSSEISAICSASFTDFNSKTLSSSYVSSGNFSSSIKANTCPSGCFRSNFSTSPMDFNITISFSSFVFKCICLFFLHETSPVITSSVTLSSLNDGTVSNFCSNRS
ncbi:hypothetical protein ALC56_00351, partial [Trachymyrmex septentrionalis]